MSKKIFKAISFLTIGTIISRIFGLFREIVSANFFGTTKIYDAFLIAFMIPNFFRGLLAEGALTSSFIPVFTEYLSQGKKEETKEILNITFTLSLIFTFSLFLIFFLISEITVRFLMPESKWYYVFLLVKFTFPYLIFISLSALYTGILNSYKSFFLPSISPIILDFFWILSLFFFARFFGNNVDEKIFALCIGVILGGIGQFLILVPSIRRLNYFPRFSLNLAHPAIRKMGTLFLPMIIGVAIGPINLLVDYSLANFLSSGMVSGLWYATRLYQLPLGIFGISISTAVLPWLSENFSKKEFDKFRENLYYAFKILLLTIIPSTIFLVLLKKEIITFLFKRGMFDLKSVELTSYPLFFYSLGLIFYGGISVLTRCFYAFNDTRTPVKIGIFSIATNFILDIILMKFLAHGGIALSTSIVGMINFFLLFYFFNKKHLSLEYWKVFNIFLSSFSTSFPLLIFLYFSKKYFYYKLIMPFALFLLICVGLIIYSISLILYLKRR